MDFVKLDQEGSIAYITFNRPEESNSLSEEMLRDLEQYLDEIRVRTDISVVVLQGAGEQAFCTGVDWGEEALFTEEQKRKFQNKIREVLLKVEELPQPTIAAINGVAFDEGFDLILACDFRIASRHAEMGFNQKHPGTIPYAGAVRRLPKLIGEGKALELILTNKILNAHDAYAYGLLTRVSPPEKLFERVKDFADELSIFKPDELRKIKAAVKNGGHPNLF
jgi:enoyl-CoA hydratase